MPSAISMNAVHALQGITALRSQTDDIDITEVAAVQAPAPISSEVQAMNACLKEVANMLLHSLPMTKQRRHKIQQGNISS